MDIRKVGDLDLDLLIRRGNGILGGNILRAPKLGIISFYHADSRPNRGGPAGFWEVYFRHDTTGFTLQRLTEELAGGDVLMRGHFPTYWFFLLNQAALLEKSTHNLKVLIERIVRAGKLPPAIRNVLYANKLFRAPHLHQVIIYIIMLNWERMTRHFIS
jgi:hypothetical protein